MKNSIKLSYELWNALDDRSLAIGNNYELIENRISNLKNEILSLKNSIYSDHACSTLTSGCDVISELANSGYKKTCEFNNYLLTIFTYDNENI